MLFRSGNQAFENGLKAVPSVFCHPLPDVNNARWLSCQLKSEELWNSIIFLKTAPPAEGGLKTKLPKLQQIDAIKVENVQDMIYVPSP